MSDYGKAMTDFASPSRDDRGDHGRLRRVAKKAQMESVELMLAAGKDMSET